MNPSEAYILKQPEPLQSIMMHVRYVILKTLPNMDEKFSYGIPFYYYNKKPMVYMNVLKGTTHVDVAFMKGAVLEEKFPELKDYKNRKLVRSLQIESLESIDELLLSKILKEASSFVDSRKKSWR